MHQLDLHWLIFMALQNNDILKQTVIYTNTICCVIILNKSSAAKNTVFTMSI